MLGFDALGRQALGRPTSADGAMYGQSLVIACQTAVLSIRSVGKLGPLNLSGVVSRVLSVSKASTVDCSGVVTGKKHISIQLASLLVSAVGAIRLAGKTVSSNLATTTSGMIAVAKGVHGVCTGAVSIVRDMARTLGVEGATVVTLTAPATILSVIEIGCSLSTSLAKSIARGVVASLSTVITLFAPYWSERAEQSEDWSEMVESSEAWVDATASSEAWSEESKSSESWIERTKSTEGWD